MLIGNGLPFNMGYIVMRKPKNRESASTLLAMGHNAYEANRWNPCAYDEVKVILSPKLGWYKTKILSRKEAIKAAASKRVDRKGLHLLVTRARNQCIRIVVFPNS